MNSDPIPEQAVKSTLTLKDLFADKRYDPEAFKRILRSEGVRQKSKYRNILCPCESGKKLKNCCWNRLPK